MTEMDRPPCDVAADPLVAKFLAAATADNTHRAYDADLRHFAHWGGTVPCGPDVIARYLAHHGEMFAPSTLRRRLAALAAAHRNGSHADPTKADLVAKVMRGIERARGTRPSQVTPLLISDLHSVVSAMGTTLLDLRDRAILLVGFFAALRRSELAALDVPLSLAGEGIDLLVRKSKVDQVGKGRIVRLATRADALCPARALREWIVAAGLQSGPLFPAALCRVHEAQWHLSPMTISRVVKRRVAAIGFSACKFSGHSLRAGFASTAALAGWDATLIARQTGHRSQQALSAYVRAPDLPSLPGFSCTYVQRPFLEGRKFHNLSTEQYALLRGVETSHEWNVAGHFGDALTHAVGEPVTYVQVSSEAKGHRDRLVRFSNSPITRDK